MSANASRLTGLLSELAMPSFLSRHFSPQHRVRAALSLLFDNFSYTARRGLIQGMKRRGGLGFLPALRSNASAEEEFFRTIRLEGMVVYDVGAFEGLMALFFARECRTVVCYEPNPRNAKRVRENVSLNGLQNVIVREVAASSRQGVLTISCDRTMPGAGSADLQIRAQIGRGRATSEFSVRALPIDDDIALNGLPLPDFVKIDVEGLELDVLIGMTATIRRSLPYLYLEMHGADIQDKIARTAEIVRTLAAVGYNRILHVETARFYHVLAPSVSSRGHLFCLPQGRPLPDGFERFRSKRLRDAQS
jgi:FkbM family methyltransferase